MTTKTDVKWQDNGRENLCQIARKWQARAKSNDSEMRAKTVVKWQPRLRSNWREVRVKTEVKWQPWLKSNYRGLTSEIEVKLQRNDSWNWSQIVGKWQLIVILNKNCTEMTAKTQDGRWRSTDVNERRLLRQIAIAKKGRNYLRRKSVSCDDSEDWHQLAMKRIKGINFWLWLDASISNKSKDKAHWIHCLVGQHEDWFGNVYSRKPNLFWSKAITPSCVIQTTDSIKNGAIICYFFREARARWRGRPENARASRSWD